MSGTTTNIPRTFGTLIGEARTILHDLTPVSGDTLRYTDDQMFEAINGAMLEARSKRPELFLTYTAFTTSGAATTGMRAQPLFYSAANDMNTTFPLPLIVYPAFVYYVVGRCELREDTFSEDSRAVTLMNKFVSALLSVQS